MNISIITTLITDTLTSFALALVSILGAGIGIGVAYLVFRKGWLIIQGRTWQTFSPFLDRLTYKPYKNYNRFRSRSWNVEHTANI